MSKLKDKIICFMLSGFLGLTLIFTFIFNFPEIKSALSERKDRILNFSFSGEYFGDLIKCSEEIFDSSVFMKKSYVDLYGGLQKVMFKDIIWDSSAVKTIMRGSDGKLYSVGNITQNLKAENIVVDYDALDNFSKKIVDFNDFLKARNTEFLYVQAPSRYDSEFVKLPLETLNNGEIKNINYFCSLLEEKNINVINTQELYKKYNLRFDELFFKTDHHWTVKTSFWAYGKICEYINLNTTVNLEEKYYSLNNYDVKTVKNCYLGSYGVRTGRFFAGADDFDFITPKFETSFKKTISKSDNLLIESGGGIECAGDFKQAVLSYYPSDNEKNINPIFGTYVSPDRSEVIIENKNIESDKKILIIKDSFALPVSAFLSTCFKETRMIDLRAETEKTAKEYVEEYKPDLVLILYNPGAFGDNFFNFGI